jgi:hypothetical protein
MNRKFNLNLEDHNNDKDIKENNSSNHKDKVKDDKQTYENNCFHDDQSLNNEERMKLKSDVCTISTEVAKEANKGVSATKLYDGNGEVIGVGESALSANAHVVYGSNNSNRNNFPAVRAQANVCSGQLLNSILNFLKEMIKKNK